MSDDEVLAAQDDAQLARLLADQALEQGDVEMASQQDEHAAEAEEQASLMEEQPD